MYKTLSPGAVGIRGLSLPDAIELASRTGFGGLFLDVRQAAELAAADGVGHVRDLFARAGVRPGNWGLPVAWNRDGWRDDLRELPRFAALAQV